MQPNVWFTELSSHLWTMHRPCKVAFGAHILQAGILCLHEALYSPLEYLLNNGVGTWHNFNFCVPLIKLERHRCTVWAYSSL